MTPGRALANSDAKMRPPNRLCQRQTDKAHSCVRPTNPSLSIEAIARSTSTEPWSSQERPVSMFAVQFSTHFPYSTGDIARGFRRKRPSGSSTSPSQLLRLVSLDFVVYLFL
eukprot:TRINITY_DN9296_c0_g1_i2.p1 TRINITY_DN9296_c0_g1~~TRINITY_DN9296_c0_g1_i2.p1  ORF type:complete len:112 (-),score=7.07 TRINITY_DN9296_c0_g1_i2:115-450(-)